MRPLILPYAQILKLPEEERSAILDCTGGGFTERQWRGVRVEWLLDLAGVRPEARFVRFLSVTGYRWRKRRRRSWPLTWR